MHSLARHKPLPSPGVLLNHYILFSQSVHVINRGRWKSSLALCPFPLLAPALVVFFLPLQAHFPPIHSQPGRLAHMDIINILRCLQLLVGIGWWKASAGHGDGGLRGRCRYLLHRFVPFQFKRDTCIPLPMGGPFLVATLWVPQSSLSETLQARGGTHCSIHCWIL